MTDLKVNRGFALLEEMLQMTHEEHAGRHGARHQTRRFGLGNSFALQVETKHHSIADLTVKFFNCSVHNTRVYEVMSIGFDYERYVKTDAKTGQVLHEHKSESWVEQTKEPPKQEPPRPSPPPQSPPPVEPEWSKLLGSPRTLKDAEKAYRKLTRECHPDIGGSHDKMVALNQAMEQARKWLK